MSNELLYDELVMEHIRNARNFRALPDAHRRSHGTNALCGDELGVFLKLRDDRIAEVAFQCTCCGISMASASMMTERMTGIPVAEARDAVESFVARAATTAGALDERDAALRALLDTVRRFPARARCAQLAWLTLDGALDGLPGITVT